MSSTPVGDYDCDPHFGCRNIPGNYETNCFWDCVWTCDLDGTCTFDPAWSIYGDYYCNLTGDDQTNASLEGNCSGKCVAARCIGMVRFLCNGSSWEQYNENTDTYCSVRIIGDPWGQNGPGWYEFTDSYNRKFVDYFGESGVDCASLGWWSQDCQDWWNGIRPGVRDIPVQYTCP